MDQIDILITQYFKMGLQHVEILQFLRNIHGIFISLRTLKRPLQRLRLSRRTFNPLQDVYNFVNGAVAASAQMHGYRWMHLKCIQNGLAVSQDMVRKVLKVVDPEGVHSRKRRRLRRRQYFSKGPNYLWHMDSYDKLKRYGICINGCIDGFSRHIIWLRASSTSSDPKVIANYYLNAVGMLGGCSVTTRSDCGTENGVVKALQILFCDLFREENNYRPAHINGRSTANQRIESWWSILRKENAQYWINLFEFLRDEALLFEGTYLDKSLIQYCFLQLIQEELHQVDFEWNIHRIRRSRNSRGPTGRPICMFELPENYGRANCLVHIPQEIINVIKEDRDVIREIPFCDNDVKNLCDSILCEREYIRPNGCNAGDAINLYYTLRTQILHLLQTV